MILQSSAECRHRAGGGCWAGILAFQQKKVGLQRAPVPLGECRLGCSQRHASDLHNVVVSLGLHLVGREVAVEADKPFLV